MKKTTKDLKLVMGLVAFILMGLLVISAGVSAENISNETTYVDNANNQTAEADNTSNQTAEVNNTSNQTAEVNTTSNQTAEVNNTSNQTAEVNTTSNQTAEVNNTSNQTAEVNAANETIETESEYVNDIPTAKEEEKPTNENPIPPQNEVIKTETKDVSDIPTTKKEAETTNENPTLNELAKTETEDVSDKPTAKEEEKPTNSNPIPPHFSSKAMSADDKSPGRLAVQITNIMGNPSIEAQIIIDIPDDIEVSGSVGALEGKASYNTIKLDIPSGGVTYIEIPFTAKEPGRYRTSATMYWKWKGTNKLHQIGFDHTIHINENTGEIRIQKPGDKPGNSEETNTILKQEPTSNQLLLIIVLFLGLAVVIAVWKKPKFIFRHND